MAKHKSLIERVEEAENNLTIALAIAASRGRALELADRRVVELELANRDLIKKLEARKPDDHPKL